MYRIRRNMPRVARMPVRQIVPPQMRARVSPRSQIVQRVGRPAAPYVRPGFRRPTPIRLGDPRYGRRPTPYTYRVQW